MSFFIEFKFVFILFMYPSELSTKWCYSPDVNSIQFCSALNPDSYIRNSYELSI